MSTRNLVLVLGDQLHAQAAVWDDFDPQRDAVWMAEVASEATHVWSHQTRIAFFLAAMRHFRDQLRRRGFTVHYRRLDESRNRGDFASELAAAVDQLRPERLRLVQPGEWRVDQLFRQTAQRLGVDVEVLPDRHFLCTPDEFAQHARGRRQLRLEYFYREMRRRTGTLMDGAKPTGGAWNYDAENRSAFGKSGPASLPAPVRFRPDATTREVLQLVARRFAGHPGQLDRFDWPVTAVQARRALDDFLQHRLPHFGQYQDAMWTGQPYLYHARLSAAMNVKLLDPRDVIEGAEAAYRAGHVPLAAAEGFIRQVLGWREYVRGVYWLFMPEYQERNALGAQLPLPGFYWTGQTRMNCLREVIAQTLQYGYAHHIQRLMITGLFALLLGVQPQAVHEWYLAVYVDAVEWVELPNTLGMSQFADGGVMASKPYAASGKYIQRMSDYCRTCPFDPAQATGEQACPFTTLYWDFLARHEPQLASHRRMVMQIRNLRRMSTDHLRAVRDQAARLRATLQEAGG